MKLYKVFYREICYRMATVPAQTAEEAKAYVKNPQSNYASQPRHFLKQTVWARRDKDAEKQSVKN